jgi:hypothetical protein
MDEIKPYNIATDIIGDRYVSTAMHPTFISAYGRQVETYETFIWEWNGVSRGVWLRAIYHGSEPQARKVHRYITANLRKKAEGAH